MEMDKNSNNKNINDNYNDEDDNDGSDENDKSNKSKEDRRGSRSNPLRKIVVLLQNSQFQLTILSVWLLTINFAITDIILVG